MRSTPKPTPILPITTEKTDILAQGLGSKYTIQRSKGLGENDPDMMSLTTMNPATRRLVKVEPSDGGRHRPDVRCAAGRTT